jgi:hypothetical protein
MAVGLRDDAFPRRVGTDASASLYRLSPPHLAMDWQACVACGSSTALGLGAEVVPSRWRTAGHTGPVRAMIARVHVVSRVVCR